jgi:hypothetical protein
LDCVLEFFIRLQYSDIEIESISDIIKEETQKDKNFPCKFCKTVKDALMESEFWDELGTDIKNERIKSIMSKLKSSMNGCIKGQLKYKGIPSSQLLNMIATNTAKFSVLADKKEGLINLEEYAEQHYSLMKEVKHRQFLNKIPFYNYKWY